MKSTARALRGTASRPPRRDAPPSPPRSGAAEDVTRPGRRARRRAHGTPYQRAAAEPRALSRPPEPRRAAGGEDHRSESGCCAALDRAAADGSTHEFPVSRVPRRIRALYSTHEHTLGPRAARRRDGNLADVALPGRARLAVVVDGEPRLAVYPAPGLLGRRRARPPPDRGLRRDGVSRRARALEPARRAACVSAPRYRPQDHRVARVDGADG